MGKLNSRRTGDGGAKAAALPTKQRKARGGTVPETEKKYGRETKGTDAATRWRTLDEHVASTKTRSHRQYKEICCSCSRCCSLPIDQAGL